MFVGVAVTGVGTGLAGFITGGVWVEVSTGVEVFTVAGLFVEAWFAVDVVEELLVFPEVVLFVGVAVTAGWTVAGVGTGLAGFITGGVCAEVTAGVGFTTGWAGAGRVGCACWAFHWAIHAVSFCIIPSIHSCCAPGSLMEFNIDWNFGLFCWYCL